MHPLIWGKAQRCICTLLQHHLRPRTIGTIVVKLFLTLLQVRSSSGVNDKPFGRATSELDSTDARIHSQDT